MKKNILYFDTSSVNFIFDKIKYEEIKELRKKLQNEFNGIPVISPLALYEILCSSNDDRRNDLIMTCQLFFGKKIFPSPSELLENYIKNGFPLIGKNNIKYKSKTEISNVWLDVASNYEKTICIDVKEFKEYRKVLNKYSKVLYKAINNNFEDNNDNDNNDIYIMAITAVNQLYNSLLPVIEKELEIDTEKELLIKTNIFFILFILIFFESPFNNNYDFWKNKKISTVYEKTDYILNNMRELFFRGPTIIMSHMALYQSKKEFSRGILVDCLHSGYFSCCDYYFSNDDHFIDFDKRLSTKTSFGTPCKVIEMNFCKK